jgi:hypothetical protein
MSMSIRHRAGLVFVGLVMSAPLLGFGTANAATTTVTFSGQPLLGISTLACPSTPSQGTITVTAGTTVDFVNRTGKTATLWAGDSQKDLPDKSLVPVTFTQGPASVVVQMLPKCSLDLGKHIQMTVKVVPAGAKPTTAPTTRAASGSGSGSAATPHSTSSHTTSAVAPSTSPTRTPTPAKSSSAAAVATDSSAPSAGDSNPFAAAPAGDAAKPVMGTVAGPAQPRSASGLLTLIATVGVVGVSAAAIRAILAQRASRALTA